MASVCQSDLICDDLIESFSIVGLAQRVLRAFLHLQNNLSLFASIAKAKDTGHCGWPLAVCNIV